jgi:Flp pilus assembly protein TadD
MTRYRPALVPTAVPAVAAALSLFAMLVLGGCATPDPAPASHAYFLDGRFDAPAGRINADDIFALDDAMRRYLRVEIAPQLRRDGLALGLFNALYSRDQLKLEYDATITRTAASTFALRRGNCLSLVIMTAALAQELGLQVTYQAVLTDETWSRSGDMAFLSTHVNLMLGRRPIDTVKGYNARATMTIDFLPPEEIAGLRTQAISESAVAAMFMNNRAAEEMAAGQLDNAYWWARAAIVRNPAFTSAYNTLGVVYLRHGDLPAARLVLARALELDARDSRAMSNLALVLQALGQDVEAAAMRARLARMEPFPPYHYFFLGAAAMQRGDYRVARAQFEKEVDRADYSSEFHFWLGVANYRLGDLAEARKQLSIAMQNSTTRADYALYAAKLEHLRAQERAAGR